MFSKHKPTESILPRRGLYVVLNVDLVLGENASSSYYTVSTGPPAAAAVAGEAVLEL
jgi:hypothetical protein